MSDTRRLFNDTMRAIALALDMDEGEKLYHGWRVGLLAHRIGQQLRPEGHASLYWAGLLHDIGAVGIQNHVVHHAAGGFTDPAAREHSVIGARILRPLSLLAPLADIVFMHHERVDGKGFPNGLWGNQIPIEAGVVLAADTIDVALRGCPCGKRRCAAWHTAAELRNGACRPEIADAAQAVIAADPSLADSLYDEPALKDLVTGIEPEPPPLPDRRAILAQMLWVIARIVDAKHTYTVGHSLRMAHYARRIAQGLGGIVDEWDVMWAGLLHDVGNIASPRAVLDKRGELDTGEWVSVRQHPEFTREFVESIADLAHLALPAASHHERYDGSGYPRGLAAEEIPLIGRILAYADIFDALTNERPYRGAMSPADALRILRGLSGTALDPHLADAAFEALSSVQEDGPEQIARGFAAIVDSDTPDLERLTADESGFPQPPDSSLQGALLVGLEPWTHAELSSRLWVLSGGESLGELIPAIMTDNLLEALDQPSAAQLLRAAQLLEPGKAHTQYVFTRAGTPFEVILQKSQTGFSLLARSARNRLQTMDRMALFYRNFLSSVHGVVFMSPNRRILDVNRAFLDMHGVALRDVVGRTPEDFRVWDATAELSLAPVPGGSWTAEIVHRTATGEPIDVAATISSVRDSNGICTGLIGEYVDITEKKRAERELQTATEELRRKAGELERVSRFKSDLMAITSHDVRSPLAAVLSAVNLLRTSGDRLPLERIESYLDRIGEATRQVLRLVEDILDLEKAESGRFQLEVRRVHIQNVLSRCVESIAGAHPQLVFKLEVEGVVPPAQVDAARLEQAFTNLIANAAKFSPAGSTIRAVCKPREQGGATVLIEDQGPGVPAEDLESIFDRYYQVSRRGAVPKRGFGVGLGLTIVKTIIDLHRGSVRVENRNEGGCRFVVEVPGLPSSSATDLPALLVAGSDARPDGTIEMLARAGVSAVAAADASEARRVCEYEMPSLVIVFETVLSRDVVRLLRELRDMPEGRGPRLVCIRQEAPAGHELFHHELVSPVVDVELFEIVKEIRLSP